MKKSIKTALSALLVLAVGVVPTFAVGATDGGAETGSGANAVRKFTPVIDGVIDEEYLSSFHIDHEWSRNPELQGMMGKYSSKDSNGNPQEPVPYGWDCQVMSYVLWDDENLYFAFDVTDDDYGCIDDEHYELANEFFMLEGPAFQDGIIIHMEFMGDYGGLFVSRDGKVLFGSYPPTVDETFWADVLSWSGHRFGDDGSYHKVTETEDGYVIEACIRIKDEVREDLLRDGGGFSCAIVAVDSTENSPYTYYLINDDYTEIYFLEDTVILNDGIDPETNEVILKSLTISDEKDETTVADDTEAEAPDETTAPVDEAVPSAPQTGDGAVTALMITLLGASLTIAVMLRGKKERVERDS